MLTQKLKIEGGIRRMFQARCPKCDTVVRHQRRDEKWKLVSCPRCGLEKWEKTPKEKRREP